MPESKPPPRLPKAVVGNAQAVAKMLASTPDAVLMEHDAGRLPAPLIVCGQMVWRLAEIREWVEASCPDRATWERRTRKPRAKPTKASPKQQSAGKQYDNFKIPGPGKSVLAWAKRMELAFETALVEGMGRDGIELGYGDQFARWNHDQVHEVCMRVISFIRGLPTYSGQYEYLMPGGASGPP